MKFIKIIDKPLHVISMFGDCRVCGHSLMYHAPIFGCMKCDCEEFS